MKVQQVVVTEENKDDLCFSIKPNFLLIFGATKKVRDLSFVKQLKSLDDDIVVMGCSTAGEIIGEEVVSDSMIVTAVEFEHTKVRYRSVNLKDYKDSVEAGKVLIGKVLGEGLKHVFVLSDGLHVNGAELVDGIRVGLPDEVSVSGGLAGDGEHFKNTYVIDNSDSASENIITAVGLYGDRIKVGCGSMGGWEAFGGERIITKAEKNVLYELDGLPALAVYKSLLGEKAKQLPSSGLLYPLSLREKVDSTPVVRTILGVDEELQSLTFAGNIPEGSKVRLMKSTFDQLINGAGESAEISMRNLDDESGELAVLISCVGRKLVLKQMIQEEVEAVREVIGDQSVIAGYYSYGEIAPNKQFSSCALHNQTMTITVFKEA